MDETEIRERLQVIFREIFDDASIVLSDAMSALDIEEWDSLTHIQLIVTVEESFSINFMTAEIANLQNVGEFIGLVRKKLEGHA